MGVLFAVEGMDAAGKATQTKRLRDRIIQSCDVNADVMLHDFPHYPTATGQAIEGHLKHHWTAEAKPLAPMSDMSMRAHDEWHKILNARVRQALFLADKCEWSGEICRRLAKGDVVILDRYWMSGYAYGTYDGLDAKWLTDIHYLLPKPTAYFYIDIPLEESIKRRPERRDSYETNMDCLLHVRKTYIEQFSKRNNADESWHIVDGMGTPDEVHERIWDIAQRYV